MQDAPQLRSEPVPAPARAPGRLDRFFTPIVAVLCLGYLAIELAYVQRIPLSMDELQGAHAVYQLRHRMPYAELTPYKTVLGYYLQLPFLGLSDDLWERLLWVKRGMAALTAIALFFAARSLGRVLARDAVLLSFVALLSMSSFLERASELRVDALTAMAGLLSFAWLLERRFVVSGLAAGLSFLVSQKGAYYCAAGAIALATHFWVLDRHRPALRNAARYALAVSCVIGAYLAVFSLVGAPGRVAEQTLAAAARTALDAPYATLWKFWHQTIIRNPYFYATSALGIGLAFGAALRNRRYRDWVVWSYAGSVLALCLWHKQPWPYFFVMVIPFLWVPLAFLFETLERRGLLFWLLFVGLGLVAPLARVPDVLALDHAHQEHALRLAERLLDPDETYLAGMHAVMTRKQSPSSLAWLDKDALDRLRSGRTRRALNELREAPPKLLLWNYRLETLPFQLRRYLLMNYDGLSGAVRVYAPYVEGRKFHIAHAGKYRLVSGAPVVIDQRKVEPNAQIRLRRGLHRANRTSFRLVWAPPRARLGAAAKIPPGGTKLFEAVYTY